MIIDYSQIQQLAENNLELKVTQQWVASSQAKIKSTGSHFIPEVSLYAKTENENAHKIGKNTSAGIFANINLFNGFKDIEQNKIASLDYEVKKLTRKKSYNDLIFLAKLDYWQALKTQEYIKMLEEYQAINKSNRSLISKKVLGGLIPKSEELNSKKVEFNISEEMVKAKDELNILKSDLRKLFTIKRDEPIEFKGSIETNKMNLLVSGNKIDLALVKAEEERGQAEKLSSSLWRMPKVNLYADQSFTDLRDGEFLIKTDNQPRVFGIKVILPLIGEKNNDSVEEQAKKRELEALTLKRKAQLIERENEDEKKLITINYLKNSIDRSKNKVDLSKEILTKITAEFKMGVKEADSLNDSAEKYIEAQKDLLDHKIEYILAIEQAQLNNLE
ncbi:MAG: TolC family protein [Bacteriovorax sp.]|nr:TolC family protein [Bacteriovorax sp.]